MLVISIVVMLLLTTIVLNSSLNSIQEVQEVKVEDEIRNLREAANDRAINHERNEYAYPLVGKNIEISDLLLYIRSIPTLSSSEASTIIADIEAIYSADTSDDYRVVGSTEALDLGVSNIDPEHYYIIDYYYIEVYGPLSSEIVEAIKSM